MASYDVIVSIKLCLDEDIILCNFGSRIMNGFEVVDEGLRSPFSGHE